MLMIKLNSNLIIQLLMSQIHKDYKHPSIYTSYIYRNGTLPSRNPAKINVEHGCSTSIVIPYCLKHIQITKVWEFFSGYLRIFSPKVYEFYHISTSFHLQTVFSPYLTCTLHVQGTLYNKVHSDNQNLLLLITNY